MVAGRHTCAAMGSARLSVSVWRLGLVFYSRRKITCVHISAIVYIYLYSIHAAGLKSMHGALIGLEPMKLKLWLKPMMLEAPACCCRGHIYLSTRRIRISALRDHVRVHVNVVNSWPRARLCHSDLNML